MQMKSGCQRVERASEHHSPNIMSRDFFPCREVFYSEPEHVPLLDYELHLFAIEVAGANVEGASLAVQPAMLAVVCSRKDNVAAVLVPEFRSKLGEARLKDRRREWPV